MKEVACSDESPTSAVPLRLMECLSVLFRLGDILPLSHSFKIYDWAVCFSEWEDCPSIACTSTRVSALLM